MIAFASLFLGLVYGVQTVTVVVGAPVAAVELRLDGARVGLVDAPPWTTSVDFGAEIAPHLLEAVALDAESRELERTSQWLNLPQPRAVANVVFEPRQEGQPRVARLTWESAAGARPESVEVTLDGQPVATSDDLHRLVLPAVDERELHLLHVDLRFENRVSTRLDLTFGGQYVDEISTEITALPLVATREVRRAPSVEAARGWFLKGGEPLTVLAIEKEDVEVVIVLDRPFPRFFAPGERGKIPDALFFDADESVRFLATVPQQSQGVTTTFELFPISRPYGGETADLYSLLAGISRPQRDRTPRPASAVAVAGLAAFEGNHRRAVVLVPDSQPPAAGADEVSPERVRRYLERLGVPFVVWNPESRTLPHVAAWGEVRPVGSMKSLAAAFAELCAELDKQWIVWLDGRHRPQDVTLAPAAEGFALLAREPGR